MVRQAGIEPTMNIPSGCWYIRLPTGAQYKKTEHIKESFFCLSPRCAPHVQCGGIYPANILTSDKI